MTVARVFAFRLGLTLGVVICAVAAAPGAATAGTYDVVACDAAPAGANHSWTGTASPAMSTGTGCPTGSEPQHGMWAAAKVSDGRALPSAAATMAFDAPPGASIASLGAQFVIRRKASIWGVGLFADGTMLQGCLPNVPDFCNFPSAWPGKTGSWKFPQGVKRVYAQTVCGSPLGCPTGPPTEAPFFDRAGVRIHSATVRVRDDTAPAVSDARDGGLTSGGWQRGTRSAGYVASDNVGIRLTRVYVDGVQRGETAQTCDFTRRAPCPNVPYGRYPVDTQALADGPHQLRIQAVDTAGNTATATRTFNTDNSAPNAPAAVSVDGGESWRRTNGFRLSWASPPSAAPIAAAHYELCNTATAQCTTGERRGDGVQSIPDLAVPGPGDYSARVWVEDAAGNVNAANRSVPVHLRFDEVAPGTARPVAADGWIGAAGSRNFAQRIEMAAGEPVPVSGVAGYSVTTDGSDPDGSVDTHGDTYMIGELQEGVTRLRARAISGSGVPSASVGETSIRVDRTPPAVDALGAPDPGAWQRNPVTLRLTGSDQIALSGMTPAPPDRPLESGAHLAYRVDGGETQLVRGGEASVTLPDEGQHSVTYRAFDAAGNDSGERTTRVLVDLTAPEGVVFEPQDAADPRRLRVSASDRLSGVAAGTIELRPAGSTAAWQPLATTRQGDQFVAQIDDEALSGPYELRARVTDRAGNQTIGDHRRDGSPATVDVSALRFGSSLRAAAIGLAPNGQLPFGRGATVRGTLALVSGIPLAGAAVDVEARMRMQGAPFVSVARVRTDATGSFAYAVPAGASRDLRFRYAGSPLARRSEAVLSIRVPATATIRAGRSSVRNGQSVKFDGRLPGRPIPAGGKVVDLQAFYRGRWRTFATPRAASDGRWSYVYRFGATRGRVVYRFRVKVRPESAYPYELGYSKVVKVTVSG